MGKSGLFRRSFRFQLFGSRLFHIRGSTELLTSFGGLGGVGGLLLRFWIFVTLVLPLCPISTNNKANILIVSGQLQSGKKSKTDDLASGLASAVLNSLFPNLVPKNLPGSGPDEAGLSTQKRQLFGIPGGFVNPYYGLQLPQNQGPLIPASSFGGIGSVKQLPQFGQFLGARGSGAQSSFLTQPGAVQALNRYQQALAAAQQNQQQSSSMLSGGGFPAFMQSSGEGFQQHLNPSQFGGNSFSQLMSPTGDSGFAFAGAQHSPGFQMQSPHDVSSLAANPFLLTSPFGGPGMGSPSAGQLMGPTNLPSVNYPYSLPDFSNSYLGGSNDFTGGAGVLGFKGRTDLPSSYVYPFAPSGSPVIPDSVGGAVFALGPNGGLVPAGQLQSGGSPHSISEQLQQLQMQQLLLLHQNQQQQLLQQQQQQQQNLGGFSGSEFGSMVPSSLSSLSNNPFGGSGLGAQSSFLQSPGGGGIPGIFIPGASNLLPMQYFGKRGLNETDDAGETEESDEQYILEEKSATAGKRSRGGVRRRVPTVVPPPTARTGPAANVLRGTLLPSSQIQSSYIPSPSHSPPVTDSCPQCIPVDFRRMIGTWTQLYGNRDSINTIITSLALLTQPEEVAEKITLLEPTCVAFRVSPSRSTKQRGLPLTLGYNVKTNVVEEVPGRLMGEDNSNEGFYMHMEPSFVLPFCMIKSGPDTGSKYDYLIMTETAGKNRCKNSHIFVRDPESFDQKYKRSIHRYLSKEILADRMNTIKRMASPQFCLDRMKPKFS